MARRRILYLLVLLVSVIFYWAYQEWLAWVLLVAALCLPVLSLILSLPSLFGLRLQISCPYVAQCGDKIYVRVTNNSWFPSLINAYILSVYKPLTKTKTMIKSTDLLSTACCGKLECRIEKVLVSDYLGLFNFRIGTDVTTTVTVRPTAAAMPQLPQLHQRLAQAWKPKPGGGFAENHEVRLYRPGDNLNQIHWKLSAKSGKLVIREPMIPAGQKAVVGMCLYGSEEELDAKFSKLVSVCMQLLRSGMPFEVQAMTSKGLVRYPVETQQELTQAIDQLLGMEPAEEELGLPDAAARIYWIGGNANDQ